MSVWTDSHTRAAAIYNAASDYYDHPANSFWDRFGRRTVERLNLRTGARVLDVCCGSGASALPAAEVVGPNGSVLGVDLAEDLLHLARSKADRQGLRNVEFRVGDMLDLGLDESAFDAVICVFGIFFVQDMVAAAREMWRCVAPGGTLTVTTWGPRYCEPANTLFWNAIRDLRPDLYKGFNPWDRITDPEAVRALFAEAGIAAREIILEPGTHPFRTPDDWWPVVLGTGYRATIDALAADDRARVQRANLDAIRAAEIQAVEMNVVYAVAARTS